jgi:hypothetical protein
MPAFIGTSYISGGRIDELEPQAASPRLEPIASGEILKINAKNAVANDMRNGDCEQESLHNRM